MSAANTEQSEESTGEQRTPDQIRSLYEQCLRKEKDLRENLRSSAAYIRDSVAWELTFPKPWFLITGGPDTGPAGLVAEGQKYRGLLEVLRKAPNRDTRWYWIAQWLKDEGVAAPHQVLPEQVFRRLTKEAHERLRGFSLTDFLYADLVGAWLPYSEALLADAEILRQQGKDPARELLALGYADVPANRAAKRWRSAVEFTCEWLADRMGLPLVKPRQEANPARTLRNAYSRVYGSRRRAGRPPK